MDIQSFTDALSLTSEAAAVALRSRLLYANAAACRLAGRDFTGESVAEVFGKDIAGVQAQSFVSHTELGGRKCAVRSTVSQGLRVLFIEELREPVPPVKDAMLYTMRTQLMNIRMCTDRLAEEEEPALRDEVLRLRSAYYRLYRLVQNADISYQAAKGELPSVYEELDMAELCRSYIRIITDVGCRTKIFLAGAHCATMMGDRAQLGIALVNLISNCLVHARGCTEIRVNVLDGNERVILAVTDNGSGIERDELKDVFHRYSTEHSVSQIGTGVGLGLTVVRTVAEKHGGGLVLESRAGIGTTVRMSLAKKQRTESVRSAVTEPMNDVEIVLTGLADQLDPEKIAETEE